MATVTIRTPHQHSFGSEAPPQSEPRLNIPVLPSQVRANHGIIPGHQLGWLQPTPASTPLPEIRRLLDTEGYVWVKNLLPRDDVLRMREHFFSQFRTTGLLEPESEPVDGLYNKDDDIELHKGVGGGNPAGDEELRIMTDAHRTDEYMKFLELPELRQTICKLMGWEKEVMLRRTLLRHNVPGGSSTGVHYDRLFLRQGDAFFLTAWVPIGDISRVGGGLYYLKDSVKLGQAIEADFNERAKHDGLSEAEKLSAFNKNMNWDGYLSDNTGDFETKHMHLAMQEGWHEKEFQYLIADFEAGDVVFHHPSMIHGSLGNDDEQGRIRLSTDLRFYDKKDFDAGRADNRWTEFWTATDRL